MNQRRFNQALSPQSVGWLLLLLVLVFNFAIRWRLHDQPLERDEGEYAYAGQLIREGIPPYQLAWNMKLPGVYYAYAGLMTIFGESSRGIHNGLILVTSISILLIFLIGRKLMGARGGVMAAALFTLLSALPLAFGLAGHATHFVDLCVCLGTFVLLQAAEKKSWRWFFTAGIAFGAGILMKQHAFVFVLAALAGLFWSAYQRKEKVAWPVGIFLVGVAVPLGMAMALMAWLGVWDRFSYWTFQYARHYVSILPWQTAPVQFASGFGPVFNSGLWVWLVGVAGLALLFFRSPMRNTLILAAGLFLVGLVATCPGFYFREHYFIMAMPGLALLNAAILLALGQWLKKFPQIRVLKFLPPCLFLIIAGDLLVRNADAWFQLSGPEITRQLYGVSPFSDSPKIAQFITEHSEPADTIGVLGSEPQIFFLAHRHSASGYIYVYPLTEPQPLAPVMRQEFIQEIETVRPKYVVYANALSSWRSIVVPQETQKAIDDLNHWWNGYSTNYDLVGMVDQFDDQPSQFFWLGQIAGRTNSLPPNISVYRRK